MPSLVLELLVPAPPATKKFCAEGNTRRQASLPGGGVDAVEGVFAENRKGWLFRTARGRNGSVLSDKPLSQPIVRYSGHQIGQGLFARSQGIPW
jgi:hypothetical protein